jgi:hypothetical protein
MRAPGRMVRLATAVLAGALVSVLPRPAVAAAPSPLDPAALSRGADPGVVHLVRDTIHDGVLRVPATERGRHEGLWVVAGGYLLRDYDVGRPRHVVVTFVDPSGTRRVVARSQDWIDVRVSPSGRHVAVEHATGPGLLRSVVTVSETATGHVLASRTIRLGTLAAVTDHRVLLGKRARWHDPATLWWNYDRDRVAVLSRPARTLWRSCAAYPHQWSPDGTRALASWTYFDAAGTDRWWVLDGRTGARLSTVTGRLDWDAAWEDDTHFLTLAQSAAGRAAIVRCDVSGTCERASRLWDVPVPSEPSLYYAPPPVVLAEN